MTTIHKWRIYCSTENKNYYVWDLDEPEHCPSDISHTILPPVDVQTINEEIVKIKEEDIATDGSFMANGYIFTNAANTITDNIVSFPFPINALAIEMSSPEGNEDDTVQIIIGENTTIGVLSIESEVLDTTFYTSAETISYIFHGYYIKLDDGTNINDLGRVIHIDRILNTFTVETASTNAFPATITAIKISKRILDTPVGPSGIHKWGGSKVGGSYIPANIPINIRYNNVHPTNVHKIYGTIEYLA